MSDEHTVHTRFLMGKIDDTEYLRKMAYLRFQEERLERELQALHELRARTERQHDGA